MLSVEIRKTYLSGYFENHLFMRRFVQDTDDIGGRVNTSCSSKVNPSGLSYWYKEIVGLISVSGPDTTIKKFYS